MVSEAPQEKEPSLGDWQLDAASETDRPPGNVHKRARDPEEKPVEIEGFDRGVQMAVRQINTLLKQKNQVLITIAGKTGSGKTGFANQVRTQLAKGETTSAVISTDNFYKKDGEGQLDSDKLQKAICRLQQPDGSDNQKQPVQVIIVEGWHTLGQKADMSFYMEAPFGKRIAGRLLRDDRNGFRTIKKALTTLAQPSDEDLKKFRQFEKDPKLQPGVYLVHNDYVAPNDPTLYINRDAGSLVFSVGEKREEVKIQPDNIPLLAEIGIEVR